ncbi:hypothetical protein OSCT_0296 [Oscillochloris trichoides DG-6]|uniref:Uncharacterized protein n=1 Tax=Oscillochloris trichoides DG-6 TaxID=765420 RepID=E1IAE5_9CHLR|nr:hypothetical protein OSCT_0296 [Oscillochloris trichoides DG-6]
MRDGTLPVPKASNPPGGLKPYRSAATKHHCRVPKASNPPGGLKLRRSGAPEQGRDCSESLKSARRIETTHFYASSSIDLGSESLKSARRIETRQFCARVRWNGVVPKASNPPGGLKLYTAYPVGMFSQKCSESLKSARRIETMPGTQKRRRCCERSSESLKSARRIETPLAGS